MKRRFRTLEVLVIRRLGRFSVKMPSRIRHSTRWACLLLALGGIACSGSWSAREEPNRDAARLIGSFGNQPGFFTKPRAVAITPDEKLIVIDRSGRMQRFDFETGEYETHWWLQDYTNGTPTGITLDPADGTLWVADTHYQRILQYDSNGNVLFQFGEEGTEPGQMIFPTDVCPDPLDGSLWVCEYGKRSRIMHFSVKGEFLNEWGSADYEFTDLQRPMAIAIDDEGHLYVADAGNHRILVFDRQGNRLDAWGVPGERPGELKYPYDIALTPEGTLKVCEYGNSRISHFTTDGRFLGWWGMPGRGTGELFSPWGVTVGPDGEVVVADTNNGRIHVIDRPGRAFAESGEDAS